MSSGNVKRKMSEKENFQGNVKAKCPGGTLQGKMSMRQMSNGKCPVGNVHETNIQRKMSREISRGKSLREMSKGEMFLRVMSRENVKGEM